MKYLLFQITFFTIAIISARQGIAQSNNNGINFQAIARDNFKNPAKDRKLYVASSIIQGSPTGEKVFTEEHQTNTDDNGVFDIVIGGGQWVSGSAKSLTSIDWANGPYFFNIRISIMPEGSSADWDYKNEWVDIGTTSFGSVPYALFSANTGEVTSKLSLVDTAQMLSYYIRTGSMDHLVSEVDSKLNILDTANMLLSYKNKNSILANNYAKLDTSINFILSDLNLK